MKEGATSANSAYHVPVLYNETLEALLIKKEGVYVDCTFGGGGHSKGILEQLGEKGKLIAFDQDEDAQHNVPDDKRIIFVPSNFRHLQRFLRLHKVEKADGILADLGVSSHQFNEGERGFSIRFKGPLDMRMDIRQTTTAADVLKSYNEQQLHKMFEQWGEVTNAKTLAKHIVEHRNTSSFTTIESFLSSLQPVVKGAPNKYFAQVFQALRIEVNDEMGALQELLLQSVNVLKRGGRIAMITFHSGEDRLVKNFFKRGDFEEEADENPFVNTERKKEFLVITKKPIVPTEKEVKQNSRSRSAKLRVAEKI
ncbi:MAG: 16S rRNA (cytosine(1402)-N(4))-methyltransferase RsmH [Bacteroidota bacterium]|nr:16S rRNA (cytosine(1402)-N(4))-methyltransferase RsmH [Bacteroidota bacterium]